MAPVWSSDQVKYARTRGRSPAVPARTLRGERAVFVARQVREDAPRGREVAPRAFRGRCRPLRELVRRVGLGRDGDGEELEHE